MFEIVDEMRDIGALLLIQFALMFEKLLKVLRYLVLMVLEVLLPLLRKNSLMQDQMKLGMMNLVESLLLSKWNDHSISRQGYECLLVICFD